MISVVIPVLNDAIALHSLLLQLNDQRDEMVELIVVDGGSSDESVALAHELADRVVVTRSGRALQMNAGADVARGDILWFIHADTVLPATALVLLHQAINQQSSPEVWGRFDVSIEPKTALIGVVEKMMNLRSQQTGVATGDQAIFVTTRLFWRVGGYPSIALMEDVALSKRLRQVARPIALHERVVTSGRRWLQRGVVRTILLMWWLRLCYLIGVDPQRLSSWYR
ncbi:hypothetical protein BOW53_03695 [Solemya pervernicosa gill symbiont]|uniref:Glycosyltransferase 2-like domain-containing protein n=2 Tax=Gammaproteobacteria incertae sedis TaxID=118884 RepID=A0A1T2L8Q4_9GAMM|nr:TIGR04283 family arsenosugar biosynthesis glycosyltransferase [Candidatus Reidiella endopervernicosa]OOZ41487.1 hypothetical protein BOW53_03695 [Solemya pervernicosa gill symbiont]QKQ27314.1 TIGR04283 family arsenosugar biosynthesis glycosyltransferase [Candidatus Reidiella endopervernicosa]